MPLTHPLAPSKILPIILNWKRLVANWKTSTANWIFFTTIWKSFTTPIRCELTGHHSASIAVISKSDVQLNTDLLAEPNYYEFQQKLIIRIIMTWSSTSFEVQVYVSRWPYRYLVTLVDLWNKDFGNLSVHLLKTYQISLFFAFCSVTLCCKGITSW